MNLVSKEYVACRTGGRGVLVLSEFAGSADELSGGALLVNPFDIQALAGAIHAGLEMPAAERLRRMRSMRAVISNYDIHSWVAEILATVAESGRYRSARLPAAQRAIAVPTFIEAAV